MNTILTKEYLEEEYLTNKHSVKQIAEKTGFSYSYLQAKIKKMGITRRRQFHDLTGKSFNFLTPVRFVGVNEQQQALWECECKCGGKKIVKASCIVLGEVKSCGCVWKTGVGEITGRYLANIKGHATRRNLEFDIKAEDIWDLFLKQKRRCALSGVLLVFGKRKECTTASLDRIDSSKGYTLSNVQWVHKDVNQMKSDRLTEDFLKWVKVIFEFQTNKITSTLL